MFCILCLTLVAVQLMPNLPTKSGVRNCVMLQPGEPFRLDGEMDELAVFFDWTVKDPSAVIDVDAAAALFDKELNPCGFVWWDQLQTPCQSVRFLSQDEMTGGKVGTKEEIRIHTQLIPDEVTYIVLTASIYSKDYEMQDLQDLSLTIRDLSSGYDLVTHKVYIYANFQLSEVWLDTRCIPRTQYIDRVSDT